jgi:ATP-dependent Clp protease ATP-binding subunit ClpB
VQALREQIEQVRREAEQAERQYDLDKAAELRVRNGSVPYVWCLNAVCQRWAAILRGDTALRPLVSPCSDLRRGVRR